MAASHVSENDLLSLTCLATFACNVTTSVSAVFSLAVLEVVDSHLTPCCLLPPYFARNLSATEASIFWNSGLGCKGNVCVMRKKL